MKVRSMVKLLLAGWQEPQVRPFPLKVSSKKRRAPTQTLSGTSPSQTRGSLLQRLSGVAVVNESRCSAVAPATDSAESALLQPERAPSASEEPTVVSANARRNTLIAPRPERS